MKKIKVLALCAVLVGLGGAMSALTSAQEKELHDFFVNMYVQEGGATKEQAEAVWSAMPDSTKDELWEDYQSAFGGLGSGSGNNGNSSNNDKDKDDDDKDTFVPESGASYFTMLASPASPSGLVSEVDDYMDVNSWQSVQFDKLFTHVGYNINNQFNAGLATRLGKVYTGVYFYGNLIDSTTTTTKAPKYKQTTSKTNKPGQVFQLSGLIGIGNLGIKPSILFSPKSGNYTTKTTIDGKSTTETTNSYEIYPQVDVGFNLSLDSLVLTPHAHLGFDFYPNKTTTKATKTTYSGTSNTWTMLGFGTGLELPKKDGSIITHSFSADLDFAFRSKTKGFSGDKTVTGEDGLTYGAFTLGWTGAIALADNLSVKLNSTLPIEWMVVKTSKDSNSSGTAIAPTFAASLKYQATPKLALGLSADLGLPEIDIGGTKIDNDNKSTSVRFNTEKGFALEVGAGFRFDLTQNVILDCGWTFGGNLFNNYFKDVSDNSKAFWDGLSYIFSDIQLGLSVKL